MTGFSSYFHLLQIFVEDKRKNVRRNWELTIFVSSFVLQFGLTTAILSLRSLSAPPNSMPTTPMRNECIQSKSNAMERDRCVLVYLCTPCNRFTTSPYYFLHTVVYFYFHSMRLFSFADTPTTQISFVSSIFFPLFFGLMKDFSVRFVLVAVVETVTPKREMRENLCSGRIVRYCVFITSSGGAEEVNSQRMEMNNNNRWILFERLAVGNQFIRIPAPKCTAHTAHSQIDVIN